MRRPVLVATSAAVLASMAAAGWTTGTAAADDNTDLAAVQFRADLTANGLIALNTLCSPLPNAAPTGPMICYALLSDRQVVSAIAELASPGQYRFVPITKVEPGPASAAVGAAAPGSADAAVLASIEAAVAPDSRLAAMVMQANPDIASVDAVDFFEPTGTVEIYVSTSAATADVRNAVAFAVTDVLSGLWAQGQPLRDPAATIQPRLEVTVDGTLYSSAFGMMTAIADGTMLFVDWLQQAGVAAITSVDRFDPRASVKTRHL